MNRGENSESIPIDLISEILSRLPAKSVGRFRCVSKLWGSMLSRPYFTDLFLTRSSARPRLLILVKGYGEWLLYSSAQPQNPYEKSYLVVAADFHMKFRRFYRYASGLIYFTHDQWISKKVMPVVCNPITGKYAILPELDGMGYKERMYSIFIGFDPINKQFKVLLVINMGYTERVFHILTLGTDKVKWRKIEFLIHYPFGEGICINGVLYYLAQHSDRRSYMIVCFDVRSEKFNFIDTECFPKPCGTTLINNKGKLGGIAWDCANKKRKLRMWVLEDVEKVETCLHFAWE